MREGHEASGETSRLPLVLLAAGVVALVLLAVFVQEPRSSDPMILSDHETLVSAENHDAFVGSSEYVLLDFSASWCGPCRMMAPHLQDLAEEQHDRVAVGVVNVDAGSSKSLSQRYGVNGIPHFVVLRDGKPVGTAVGYVGRDGLDNLLAEAGVPGMN